ncbi:hypothetical protein B5C34_01615 [Pacificimonas flava]|uniref:Uncharacterized protein n=2 Tax=Pacificimonas TaxID=1960290 RepID=A0A219B242_9SPHN|nr:MULTISPECIES: hypothetical protein [Pacificimonas]MBZ6378085.1 hypothetical protein [Pacificimonas aurantium]OWV32274.1 hypothetical protein B5C34_01615 [Pacificimonas flava]
MRPLLPAIFPALAIGAPAAAQVDSQQLLDCAVIVEAEQRLACFDRLAAGISDNAQRMISERRAEEQRLAAEARAEAAERARIAAEEARRQELERREAEAAERELSAVQAFGREQVEPGTGRPGQALDSIESTVLEARKQGRETWLVLLQNGHVWTFDQVRPLSIDAGETATVERALGGSYRMTIGRRSFRVKRVR